MRLMIWLGTWLAPLDPWIRRHPWLTSLATAVIVAVIAVIAQGAEAAVGALIGIFLGCRFVLYMVAKGAFGPDDDYPFG